MDYGIKNVVHISSKRPYPKGLLSFALLCKSLLPQDVQYVWIYKYKNSSPENFASAFVLPDLICDAMDGCFLDLVYGAYCFDS